MTDDPNARIAASVRQRLLNLAKARKEDYNLVLTRYALERFLHRISRSEHRRDLRSERHPHLKKSFRYYGLFLCRFLRWRAKMPNLIDRPAIPVAIPPLLRLAHSSRPAALKRKQPTVAGGL